ncbi:DNA polymerase III subunit theta [Proteus penneri]|uniref:DNA polymerase III subunit theta n=1 Tax=Proteus penneri TaxID=102862 RepID=A0A0G4Q6H8_9GAMM|nr:DNA polymerase III subunit theta [Proteus penneri]
MNLANLTQEEKDKINVDLAASGVAYKKYSKFHSTCTERKDSS